MNKIYKKSIIALFVILNTILFGCQATNTIVSKKETININTVESIDFYKDIPEWDGTTTEIVFNNGVPFFTNEEKLHTSSFIELSELDDLGRCGVAFSVLGVDTLATEERESIGMVKPSGWQTIRYDDIVEGKYLYNRGHLISFSNSGLNAEERNLITMTRKCNTEMIPIENDVHNYIEDTGNHVLYRVTPDFRNQELVARGVLVEAFSLEDNGNGICYCTYFYNEQPQITINHLTGDNNLTSNDNSSNGNTVNKEGYILNTSSKKIHLPDCEYVSSIKKENMEKTTSSLEQLESEGYVKSKCCFN